MVKSRISVNQEIYARLIAEDKSSHSDYSAFMDALGKIMELQGQIIADPSCANENLADGTPILTALENHYRTLQKNGVSMLSSKSGFVKARKHIVNDIMKSVVQDRALISKAVASGKSPQQLHREKTTAVLDISGYSGKAVGARSSQRLPIKTSDGKKGFFTPVDKYFNEKTRRSFVEPYKDKIDHFIYTALLNLATSRRWETIAKKIDKKCMLTPAYCTADDPNQNKNLTDVLSYLDVDEIYITYLMDAPEEKNIVGQIINQFGRQRFVEGMRSNIGIEDGQDVAKRNVTMCDLADIMGCGDLVAKAKHMTVVHNGKTVDGVFMENIEGVDINRLPQDSPAYDLDTEGINTPHFLHQLADLQVMDYIAGNVDRHMGNIIFDVQKNANGKPYINSLKGIDNDASFSAVTKSGSHMTPIRFMTHISENMANFLSDEFCGDKVRNMMLLKGYTRTEANAAQLRISQLKEGLLNNPQVKIVKNDDWKSYSLSQLSQAEYIVTSNGEKKVSNIFSKVESNFKRLMETAVDKRVDRYGNNIQFTETRDAEKLALETNMFAKFSRQGDRLRRIDLLRKPSDEFSEMKNKLLEIENFARNKTEQNTPLTDEEKTQLSEMTNQLIDSCSHYIALKRVVPKTNVGQQRHKFAYDLRRFAQNMLKKNFNFDMAADLEEEKRNLFGDGEKEVKNQTGSKTEIADKQKSSPISSDIQPVSSESEGIET